MNRRYQLYETAVLISTALPIFTPLTILATTLIYPYFTIRLHFTIPQSHPTIDQLLVFTTLLDYSCLSDYYTNNSLSNIGII